MDDSDNTVEIIVKRRKVEETDIINLQDGDRSTTFVSSSFVSKSIKKEIKDEIEDEIIQSSTPTSKSSNSFSLDSSNTNLADLYDQNVLLQNSLTSLESGNSENIKTIIYVTGKILKDNIPTDENYFKKVPYYKHMPLAGPLTFVDSFQNRNSMIHQYTLLENHFISTFYDCSDSTGRLVKCDCIHNEHDININPVIIDSRPKRDRRSMICFLSHFHADHYENLSHRFGKDFDIQSDNTAYNCDRIICGLLTRNLVLEKLRVDPSCVIGLPIDSWFQLTDYCAFSKRDLFIPSSCVRTVSSEEFVKNRLLISERTDMIVIDYMNKQHSNIWKAITKVSNNTPLDGVQLFKREVYFKLGDSNHCPGACTFTFDIMIFLRIFNPEVISLVHNAGYTTNIIAKRIRYLHCGDFRASNSASDYIVKHAINEIKGNDLSFRPYTPLFDRIYVDNTYARNGYNFPPQEFCYKQSRDLINAFLKDELSSVAVRDTCLKNQINHKDKLLHVQSSLLSFFSKDKTSDVVSVKNPIIIIGTYFIGKERYIIDVIQYLETLQIFKDKKVKVFCLDPKKQRAISLLTQEQIVNSNYFSQFYSSDNSNNRFEELICRMTDDPNEAIIHIHRQNLLTIKALEQYIENVNHYIKHKSSESGTTETLRVNNILAIKPTGFSGINIGRKYTEIYEKMFSSLKMNLSAEQNLMDPFESEADLFLHILSKNNIKLKDIKSNALDVNETKVMASDKSLIAYPTAIEPVRPIITSNNCRIILKKCSIPYSEHSSMVELIRCLSQVFFTQKWINETIDEPTYLPPTDEFYTNTMCQMSAFMYDKSEALDFFDQIEIIETVQHYMVDHEHEQLNTITNNWDKYSDNYNCIDFLNKTLNLSNINNITFKATINTSALAWKDYVALSMLMYSTYRTENIYGEDSNNEDENMKIYKQLVYKRYDKNGL